MLNPITNSPPFCYPVRNGRLRPVHSSPPSMYALHLSSSVSSLTHIHILLVNPLTKEHVLVSPHRTKRPWLGQTEPPQSASLPEHDPSCYLCPGNPRAGGKTNPPYTGTYVFENDYAAVLPPPVPSTPVVPHPLLMTEPVQGACDVIIFHPRHDLTLARLEVDDISRIIEEWKNIYEKRGQENGIKYIQIFEVWFRVSLRPRQYLF